MPAVATRRLSEKVGVEVLDVDAQRLIADPDLPGICQDLLERYGVVLFREVHATDAAQVEFGAKLMIAICLCMASRRRGWPWPSTATKIPPMPSK